MPVTKVELSPGILTLSIRAVFEAGPEQVWQLWENPRMLEKWWGPPSHPATFVEHDLSSGGRMSYFMTGPQGEKYHGWWQIQSVDPPERIELVDGFSDPDGEADPAMPKTKALVSIEPDPESSGTTRMLISSTFFSHEEMEMVLEMGAAEGMAEALGQIDALLEGAGKAIS